MRLTAEIPSYVPQTLLFKNPKYRVGNVRFTYATRLNFQEIRNRCKNICDKNAKNRSNLYHLETRWTTKWTSFRINDYLLLMINYKFYLTYILLYFDHCSLISFSYNKFFVSISLTIFSFFFSRSERIYYRILFLYEFKLDHNATYRNIKLALIEDFIDEWFQKFRKWESWK